MNFFCERFCLGDIDKGKKKKTILVIEFFRKIVQPRPQAVTEFDDVQFQKISTHTRP